MRFRRKLADLILAIWAKVDPVPLPPPPRVVEHVYVFTPLTKEQTAQHDAPMVWVDETAQRQMYHPPQQAIIDERGHIAYKPNPMQAPDQIDMIRTRYDLPAVKPRLVPVQETIVMRHAEPAPEDRFLGDGAVTPYSLTVKRQKVG